MPDMASRYFFWRDQVISSVFLFLCLFGAVILRGQSSPDLTTKGPAVFKEIKIGDSPPYPIFDHFLPSTVGNLVWTNVLSRTNGKAIAVWAIRTHVFDWPKHPPIVKWNTNSLIWGMSGMTALSPCWEDEGAPGQVPITALTRRHGYTRGHDMGADGFGTRRRGKKVWFLSVNNEAVEVRVKREVVRTTAGPLKQDYTILMFDRDLPGSIVPLRVVHLSDLSDKYPNVPLCPWMLLQMEQGGNVSCGLPGMSCNTGKGGDSGSANLIPLVNELVFISGRSSSPASDEMQGDMDELCRLERLRPEKYQLQWIDLSAFPSY
jgi:hypothetical protein